MTLTRADFGKKKQSEESWYDTEFDSALIEQSIAKQYHILPSEQQELHYADYKQLLAGLMEDTPLGQTVLIRREDDKERLRHFTKAEHRIRNEWREFIAAGKRKDPAALAAEMSRLENMFRKMFGQVRTEGE